MSVLRRHKYAAFSRLSLLLSQQFKLVHRVERAVRGYLEYRGPCTSQERIYRCVRPCVSVLSYCNCEPLDLIIIGLRYLMMCIRDTESSLDLYFLEWNITCPSFKTSGVSPLGPANACFHFRRSLLLLDPLSSSLSYH